MKTVETDTAAPPETSRFSLLAAFAAMLAIVLLAGALRAYALRGESVVYDEYNSIRYLDAPDALSFLREQAEYNDEMVPLYFVLQYYWAQIAGDAPARLRLLSILLGVLTVAGLFWVAWRLYGPWGAGVAALCLALSPFHLYHSLSIRPYALLALLGLVSGYSLYRVAANGGWPWWVANTVINILLMWTHVFAFWWLLAQGLFLLVFRWRWFARIAVWTAAHILALLPLLYFVLQWQLDPPTGQLVSLSKFLTFVADRESGWAVWTLFMWPETAPRPGGLILPPLLRQYGRLADLLLVAWYSACLLLLVWSFRGGGPGEVLAAPRKRRIETLVYLLVWLMLPPLLLYGFAWAWSHEAFAERYTLYGLPAMFLVLGGAVAGFRSWLCRTLAAAMLVSLFAAHAGVNLHLPLRPDFMGAARHIAGQAATGGAIVYYPPTTRATFEYNLRQTGVDPALKVEEARDLLGLLTRAGSAVQQGSRVWLVAAASHGALDTEPLDSYLRESGFAVKRRVFPGPNPIHVYGVSPGGEEAVRAEPETSPQNPQDVPRLLADAVASEQRGGDARALALYRQAATWLLEHAGERKRVGRELQEAGFSGQAGPREAFEDYLLQALDGLVRVAPNTDAPSAGLQLFQEAAGRLPQSRAVWLGFISALEGCGEMARALEATLKAARALPDEGVFPFRRGKLLQGRGETEAAMRMYRRAIETASAPAPAYLELARLLCAREVYAEAAEVCRALIARQPGHAMAHAQLGAALLGLGRCEDAVAAYAGAVDCAPANPGFLVELGRAHLTCGNAAVGERTLEKAIAAAPEYRAAYDALDAYYTDRAPAERVARWRDLAATYPDAAMPLRYLARALDEAGNTEAALEKVRGALKLEPDSAELHGLLAGMLRGAGQAAQAVAAYERAVAVAPDNAEYLCRLGGALRAQGRVEAAVQAYRRAIDAAPEYHAPYAALAELLEAGAEHHVAELERIAERYPDASRPHFELGKSLAASGKRRRAIAELRRAAAANPGDAAVQTVLGRVLFDAGRYAGAVEAFENALRINPDIPGLARRLQRAREHAAGNEGGI